MEENLKIIESLIPFFTAIIGAFIGNYFTKKNQNDLFNRQLTLEEQKEKKEILNETLYLYNKVLKADGEEIVISNIGTPNEIFEIGTYQSKIRGILYEKYHLIHSDVANLVKSIDFVIQRCDYNEDVEDFENGILVRNYLDMIENIRYHIHDFRK